MARKQGQPNSLFVGCELTVKQDMAKPRHHSSPASATRGLRPPLQVEDYKAETWVALKLGVGEKDLHSSDFSLWESSEPRVLVAQSPGMKTTEIEGKEGFPWPYVSGDAWNALGLVNASVQNQPALA